MSIFLNIPNYFKLSIHALHNGACSRRCWFIFYSFPIVVVCWAIGKDVEISDTIIKAQTSGFPPYRVCSISSATFPFKALPFLSRDHPFETVGIIQRH
nr:hypothetical 11.1K protein - rice stripe virus [Tenuivirus oryzaclavatae]